MWVHFKNAQTCSVCHVSASQASVLFLIVSDQSQLSAGCFCPSRAYFRSSFCLCSMWVHFKNAKTCSVCHVSASQASVIFLIFSDQSQPSAGCFCPSRPYFRSSFRLCSMWVHFKNANTCSVCHVSASQPSVIVSDCFWPISAISRVFLSIKTLLSIFFLLVQHVSAFQKCKNLFCVSCGCTVTTLHLQYFLGKVFLCLTVNLTWCMM